MTPEEGPGGGPGDSRRRRRRGRRGGARRRGRREGTAADEAGRSASERVGAEADRPEPPRGERSRQRRGAQAQRSAAPPSRDRSAVAAPRRARAREAGPVETANRLGLVLAGIFLVVGVVLLTAAIFGQGWSHLLGALDFLVIAGVLYWAARPPRRRASG